MQIEKVCEPIIAVRRSQYPTDNLSEFLLVGRSNVEFKISGVIKNNVCRPPQVLVLKTYFFAFPSS